ncbi:hypothetical protein [Glaciimonas sp. PAMC28666]|uniref:hypothetical protein n=1 Tax=Glaciimonas sp. PAMC28666 TaxID=2807626 RepID=UPI001963BC46|nr:hypothetical protein [Glaciimonas sp. PAMC28666]QRX82389.1 hypothetical protein JQN73_20265 [Glaciimonas sp. PAMC28666]
MKKTIIAAACLLFVVLSVAGCSTKSDANLDNFTVGMNDYLAKKGDLCLAKYSWPIDVTPQENAAGGRNALQMPVLEKVGLLRSTMTEVAQKDAETGARTGVMLTVKRYELNAAGKKYYVTKEMRSPTSDGSILVHQGDFCAAKLTLDKVVGWELSKSDKGAQEALVTYTYKIDAAPWTRDAEVQKVFPMVARIVTGAGTMQLQESFHKTDKGWVAANL